MKKFMGINRSKMIQFNHSKQNSTKRKNRFKINKDEDEDFSEPAQTNSLITNTTQNSVTQDLEITKTLDVYEDAKENLKEVEQLKKKFIAECQLRITAFKESETKKYDENISKLSKRAVDHLLKVERTLSEIRKMKGANESEEKYFRNMEKSLALELREVSKEVRNQEKLHYDRLKAYEKGTVNNAIELSETQKEHMKCDFPYEEEASEAQIEMPQNDRSQQINELVQSINKLSIIYKELNDLVIEQNSLVDRIDVNIEDTFTHVEKGNEHLRKAEEHASSPFAEKCMLALITLIVVFALILGFKYSK